MIVYFDNLIMSCFPDQLTTDILGKMLQAMTSRTHLLDTYLLMVIELIQVLLQICVCREKRSTVTLAVSVWQYSGALNSNVDTKE